MFTFATNNYLTHERLVLLKLDITYFPTGHCLTVQLIEVLAAGRKVFYIFIINLSCLVMLISFPYIMNDNDIMIMNTEYTRRIECKKLVALSKVSGYFL